MSRPCTLRALALVACAGLLAGCGDSPDYDAAAVESHLVRTQAAVFGSAVEIERAVCPADLELREGMTFTCTLTASGAELPWRVRLTHVREENGVTVSARPDGVLVSAARLDGFVSTRLPKDAAGARVDCGGEYFVARVGTSVECTLRLGAQDKPMKVKVLDEQGRLSIDA
jgi:hypothetical protein